MSTFDIVQLLPASTDIYNYIYDGSGGGRLDNVIRFYKSWILKSVRAVSKYRVRVEENLDDDAPQICALDLPPSPMEQSVRSFP